MSNRSYGAKIYANTENTIVRRTHTQNPVTRPDQACIVSSISVSFGTFFISHRKEIAVVKQVTIKMEMTAEKTTSKLTIIQVAPIQFFKVVRGFLIRTQNILRVTAKVL